MVHLSGLPLADPAFGEPQREFTSYLELTFSPLSSFMGSRLDLRAFQLSCRQSLDGSYVAGGGNTDKSELSTVNSLVTTFHASALCNDEILCKFWKIEEVPANSPVLTHEERVVVQHFKSNHSRTEAGRFIMPLPRKLNSKPIGDSRSQAVRRFLALERSLRHKRRFQEVDDVMQEYLLLAMPKSY